MGLSARASVSMTLNNAYIIFVNLQILLFEKFPAIYLQSLSKQTKAEWLLTLQMSKGIKRHDKKIVIKNSKKRLDKKIDKELDTKFDLRNSIKSR